MKLITFQHKNVLKEIERGGIYHCMKMSECCENNITLYLEIKDMLKAPWFPVFAWARILNKDLEVSLEQMNRADEMTPHDDTDLILELEVPENENYLFQEFYDYVGCMYSKFDEVHLPEERIIDGIHKISTRDMPDNNAEVQCVLPYIKKEWVKSVYEFKKEDVEEQINPIIADMVGVPKDTMVEHTRITELIKVY